MCVCVCVCVSECMCVGVVCMYACMYKHVLMNIEDKFCLYNSIKLL